MAAVAIVKNATWATATEIPCTAYLEGQWIEQSDNPRKIIVWENFNKDEIIADFYETFQ